MSIKQFFFPSEAPHLTGITRQLPMAQRGGAGGFLGTNVSLKSYSHFLVAALVFLT